MPPIPDWQLPPGVNRGLWQYLHDPAVALAYDTSLLDAHLARLDGDFVRRHCPRPGRLLDLGCGTGRLLIPLTQAGYWAVGVDLSAEMLKVVGAKATAAGVAVPRLQANLVELGCLADQSFDYAACLFSTLGMIGGADQRRRMVAHVYRLLRPGGVFILHVHNRWFNFWTPAGRKWLLRDLWRSLLSFKPGGDHLAPPYQGLPALTLHLFTRREAVRLLREAGFVVQEVRPLSLRPDGRLPWPGWFRWLRAYGYLLAASRPLERLT